MTGAGVVRGAVAGGAAAGGAVAGGAVAGGAAGRGGGLGGETVGRLRAGGLEPDAVVRAVRAALDEDFRYGPDVTSAATVAGRTVTADVVAREPGVLAGVPVALAVLDLIAEYVGADQAGDDDGSWAADPDGELVSPERNRTRDRVAAAESGDRPGSGQRPVSGQRPPGGGNRPPGGGDGVTVTVLMADGDRVAAGHAVLRVRGPAAVVLGAERTMLNFLTHLSGIATATRAWTDAIAGTGAVVRDTRKTTPGLRALEKYAVRCGGGHNHRMGLGDAALIKDNHVAAAGGIAAAVTAVRSAAAPGLVVEVECDSVAQVREALAAGARFLLLDNMPAAALREAAAVARAYDGVRLEASGGLRLANAREVAATGVDYLAVGALTHSSGALDLGLDYADEG